MDYQVFEPHQDLSALVKCYWTLEVPAEAEAGKQRIISDACLEMAFILGDDIKRFTTDTDFIIQPRAMVVGQIIEPYFIQPTGYVNTFAIRFYPHGFANFVDVPISELSDKETSLDVLFGEAIAAALEHKIIQASSTAERIRIIEEFLLGILRKEATIDKIVNSTLEALMASGGTISINTILNEDLSKRRQLERKFAQQIGLSPKQLGKVIRLQAALKMLINNKDEKLSAIAYDNEYYDQAHFIRDFKEFTGTNPKKFLEDKMMTLSSIFYKNP